MLEEATDAEVNLDFQKVLSNNNVSYRSFKSNMGWTIQREQSSANPKKKLEEWLSIYQLSVRATWLHWTWSCFHPLCHQVVDTEAAGESLLLEIQRSLVSLSEETRTAVNKPVSYGNWWKACCVCWTEFWQDEPRLTKSFRPSTQQLTTCCSLGSQAVVSVCFQHVMQHHRRQTEQPVKPKSCQINEGTFNWLFSEWWRSSSGSEWNSVEFVVILWNDFSLFVTEPFFILFS